MLVNGFVLSPDQYLTPAYRISPFKTSDIATNRELPSSIAIDDYFRERFPRRSFIYCESGRQAIRLALRALAPKAADAVTILTTTANLYISGCVTREIEGFCQWSRKIEPNTRMLLVNHEFGFPYENLRALRGHTLPIIEDAAHSFASDNVEQSVPNVGQFTVYSFPKFFPVQFGGLLVFDPPLKIEEPLRAESKDNLRNVLSAHLPRLADIRRKRRENFKYLADKFQSIGCPPRFELTEKTTPGVFMFRTGPDVDLPALKTFVQAHGIESSVFYGEHAFFLPVHERLETADLDYLFEVVRAFLQRSSEAT
jgi:dTDP-4-amino-4,6-dideoxygalactose transaminase